METKKASPSPKNLNQDLIDGLDDETALVMAQNTIRNIKHRELPGKSPLKSKVIPNIKGVFAGDNQVQM